MSEHVVSSRSVPADEWTDAHRELAESALEQGLPEPTAAEYVETTIETEDLDGNLLDLRTIRDAAVSNLRRSRLDHNVHGCPGPGRCAAHYPGGPDG